MTEADRDMAEFVSRCAIAYLIGTDASGGPQATGIGGRSGFAALLDHATLAMRLPADCAASRLITQERVALLLLDATNVRHLLVGGNWHQMEASEAALQLRRRLGISNRDRRSTSIGIVDVIASRWERMTANEPDTRGIGS
jgi:hypothetical protein